MKAAILIPARDEGKRIGKVIDRIDKAISDIIVIDDGSIDNTAIVAKNKGAHVLKHKVNLGKGIALKTGCKFASEKGYQKIVFLDADGQHPPELIPTFLEVLDEADIIFGYRQFSKSMPFVLKLGNYGLSLGMLLLHGIKIQDTQCGFRAIRTNVYDKIKWNSAGYEVESEMIINVAKNKLKYKEIPIDTIYRDKYKGTMIIDGLRIAFNIFKWRFTNRKF